MKAWSLCTRARKPWNRLRLAQGFSHEAATTVLPVLIPLSGVGIPMMQLQVLMMGCRVTLSKVHLGPTKHFHSQSGTDVEVRGENSPLEWEPAGNCLLRPMSEVCTIFALTSP